MKTDDPKIEVIFSAQAIAERIETVARDVAETDGAGPANKPPQP